LGELFAESKGGRRRHHCVDHLGGRSKALDEAKSTRWMTLAQNRPRSKWKVPGKIRGNIKREAAKVPLSNDTDEVTAIIPELIGLRVSFESWWHSLLLSKAWCFLRIGLTNAKRNKKKRQYRK